MCPGLPGSAGFPGFDLKRLHSFCRKNDSDTISIYSPILVLYIMKRYCQTLELVDDPELIRKYCEVHSHVWPEVIEGQRQVGILDMEIYRHGNRVFMICDTVDDFDWDKDMARLATLPRQAEWEAYVAEAQGADPKATSAQKWHLMDKIFDSNSE